MVLAGSVLPACVSGTHERGPSAVAPAIATAADECREAGEHAADGEESMADSGIQLTSISPPSGTRVARSTLLVADLDYAVNDFQSGQYRIAARFDTLTSDRNAGGSVPSIPVLKSPSGSLRLCVPFADVWDMPDLRHPFAVRFTLIRIDDARRNHSVASTNKLTYPLR
jgi:hypothetical protein